MSPELVFVIGCFGLGLVIAFALWAYSRDTLMQADLMALRDQLDAIPGFSGTPAHLSMRKAIGEIAELAPTLSLPIMIVYGKLYYKPLSPTAPQKSIQDLLESPAMILAAYNAYPAAVKDILCQILAKLLTYVIFWPPNALLILFVAIRMQLSRKTDLAILVKRELQLILKPLQPATSKSWGGDIGTSQAFR